MTDLLADIGGSNCRFALAKDGELLADSLWQCATRDYDSFDLALAAYLADQAPPKRACIAAAGAVRDNCVTLTNHGWTISQNALPDTELTLLNDLQAMGHALAPLGPPKQRKLVVNLGTGLNAAVLHIANGLPFVPESEAGHMRLPRLADPAFQAALEACISRFGSDAVEAAVSGTALPHLHHALTGKTLKAQDISADWSAPESEPTRTMLLSLLGHYIGDLALAHLPYGGIWLAGSLGRAIASEINTRAFQESFSSRGPYTDLMQNFDFDVLGDDKAALKGAALYLQAQAARD
ncbi:glucokinase [Lentibacter algarum]|uniref:glucokinase n=1 Tax=Lentibacter algarum TaxID=576131 RepID=UPI001C09C18C|nr:glucokinase [Lentibacter algarum]MBU2982420.1 glucokinase [Lentibacter algarum]